MDGILLMDKPQTFTSFDVVAKLRGITKERRMGHSGTLDPMATGVLVCLLGRATRLCDILPDETKEYVASMQLGMVTDTEDIWGTSIKRTPCSIAQAQLEAAIKSFEGEILQIPPMYSALKVNGQKLCNLARAGKEVERQGRKITIDRIELLEFDFKKQTAVIKVKCSKGTYIRTLISDIGEKLAAGACMTDLRRTVANGFSIDDCFGFSDVEEFMAQGILQQKLLPVSAVFKFLPNLNVGQWQKKMIVNGVNLNRDKLGNPFDGRYNIWFEDEFLGVAEFNEDVPNLKMIFRG